MKKCALFLVVVTVMMMFGVALSEASQTAVAPLVGDIMTVLGASELNGVVHGVIFFNNTQNTAMAVLLKPDGSLDDTLFGYPYFFADFLPNILWASHDGLFWVQIGSI